MTTVELTPETQSKLAEKFKALTTEATYVLYYVVVKRKGQLRFLDLIGYTDEVNEIFRMHDNVNCFYNDSSVGCDMRAEFVAHYTQFFQEEIEAGRFKAPSLKQRGKTL